MENKSYLAILTSAKSLFWKHGIRRVTVEEICSKAGVSKMTFYRIFTNKNDVAKKVLEGILNESLLQYRNIMLQQISFADKMKQVILLNKGSSNDISEEFIKDIYQNEESGMKQTIEEFSKQMMAEILNDFKTAQQNGWIRQDVKLEFIMFIQEHLSQMIMDPKLNSLYKNPQEVIMEVTNFFFYGILSETKNS
jgi:AcrR family transcriptional regulator